MNQQQKNQITALLTVLTKRHDLACDGLFQARHCLPAELARSLVEVVAPPNHPTPEALAQLMATVEAAEVTA